MQKRILILLLISLLIITTCAKKKTIKPHKDEPLQYLTILYLNDYHGHLTPFKAHFEDEQTVGGMARIATVVKSIRAENSENSIPTLFLCAGDVLQGTPQSTVFKGEPDFLCLNEIGCNAMVLGNHEFDYGQNNLNTLRSMANFAILGGNILSKRGQAPIVKAYFTKNVHGTKIHILGLTTDETPLTTHPRNVEKLVFTDPIETAAQILQKLDPDDIIIALTHLGYEMDKKLAKSVEGIDIIIGGHSHTKIEKPKKLNRTLICQAYEYGEYLGRLDLELEGGKIKSVRGKLIHITEDIEEDKEIKELVDEYMVQLDKNLKTVIGEAVSPLNGEREDIRNTETNLGNLIADVMRSMAGADIALVNAGGIRASIDKGDITIEEVLTVLPYGNHLVTLELTGSEILEILDHHAKLEPGSGGFLQVSGITMKITNQSISGSSIGGESIDPAHTYTVATNDFLAAGGDGYSTFKNGRSYLDTGLIFSDIMVDYIKTHSVIDAKVDGRITKN
jgi:5'-nucleotidase/UDP-sugar diphosphatase